MLSVLEFWNNIDRLNPYGSTKKLCDKAGIHYKNTCQQRADGYMPKPETLLKLAKALNTSIECLLTGKEAPLKYSPEVEDIAKWLNLFGTNEDFTIIRRLLRMPEKDTRFSDNYKKKGERR